MNHLRFPSSGREWRRNGNDYGEPRNAPDDDPGGAASAAGIKSERRPNVDQGDGRGGERRGGEDVHDQMKSGVYGFALWGVKDVNAISRDRATVYNTSDDRNTSLTEYINQLLLLLEMMIQAQQIPYNSTCRRENSILFQRDLEFLTSREGYSIPQILFHL